MPMSDTPENRARAEAFADRLEAKMRLVGSTGEYFCESQRVVWRQQTIRGFMGVSPDPEFVAKDASLRKSAFPPPRP
jgi:hypothetical protein